MAQACRHCEYQFYTLKCGEFCSEDCRRYFEEKEASKQWKIEKRELLRESMRLLNENNILLTNIKNTFNDIKK
jgi:hypothetical protein